MTIFIAKAPEIHTSCRSESSFNCLVFRQTLDQKWVMPIDHEKIQPSNKENMYQNVYSTMYSQAVTHPSTNMAQCCLTSVIRRELVFST